MMIINWSTIVNVFVVFPLAVLFLVKFYEAICYAYVRDVRTRKALKNHLSIWQSIKLIFYESKKPLGEKLFELSRDKFNNEPFVFFYRGYIPIVVFSSAHAAKSILIDNWKDFPKNNKMLTPHQHEFIGNSLVLMNGNEWKVNRSVLNPPFQHVDKYWNIFSEKVNYCVSNLHHYTKQEGLTENKFPLKIKDVLSRMALDVIGESALDCDFNYLDPNSRLSDSSQSEDSSQNERVLEAFRFVFKNINSWERMIGGKFYSMLPIVDNHRMEKSIRIMDNFVHSIIEKKRIEHIDRRVIDVVHPSMESAMDLMIEANQSFHEPKPTETKPAIPSNIEPAQEEDEEMEPLKISDKNLRDNTLLLFLAGHATTADALSFLLLNLALNERVQDTLYKELKEAYPDRFKIREGKYCEFIIQQLDDLATLHKLPYLDSVINENLRISPPVGLLNRISKKSHIIDGVKISKDQPIALSIKSIHYNSQLWGEKADEFCPERFASYSSTERHDENNVSNHHPICSFLPFGLGARSCLGSKFSILEQKVFIVHLLSKYLVKLPEEYQMKEKVGLGEFAHLMVGAGPLSSLGEDLKLEFVERVAGVSENVSDLIEEESNRMESAINEPTPNLFASQTITSTQFVREENKEFPQYNVNREELIRSLP